MNSNVGVSHSIHPIIGIVRCHQIEDVNKKTANEITTPFVEVPIFEDAEITTFANMALITLRSDFIVPSSSSGVSFVAGSLLSLPMSELMLNNWSNVIALYSANNPQCSLSSMSDTKDYIILKLLDNVRTRLEFWKYDKLDHTWTRKDNGNDDNESNGGIPVGEDVTDNQPIVTHRSIMHYG